jgi:GNAT superfamily N-acetyltransferase
MKFEAITQNDLEELTELQPDDWPDIVPDFRFYLSTSFCHPIKATADRTIVGIGTFIAFEKTSWLAHIIVHKDYRNKGIGFQVVQELLSMYKNSALDTCSLVATELGQPVYTKAGFTVVSTYSYFKRENPWKNYSVAPQIVPFQEKHRSDVFDLDKWISGENREKLLTQYLHNAFVYSEKEKVLGFYLPDLKEGLLFADTNDAGIALMKLKYSTADKAAIPTDNLAGIDFLNTNGFVDTGVKGTRMILGKVLEWKPVKIFSRIGGNFG